MYNQVYSLEKALVTKKLLDALSEDKGDLFVPTYQH